MANKTFRTLNLREETYALLSFYAQRDSRPLETIVKDALGTYAMGYKNARLPPTPGQLPARGRPKGSKNTKVKQEDS